MSNKILMAIAACAAISTAAHAAGGAPQSKVWQDFAESNSENVLPDFSYAGYKCGEVAIPTVKQMKLKWFDVTEFGAVASDGESDREAFIAAIAAAEANGGGVIYFPEGEFEIHAEEDPDQTIFIRSSNTIIKGAGRNKSKILLSTPYHPTNPEQLWTSPTAIGFSPKGGIKAIGTVTADAPRGSFTIEVSSTKGLKAGDWINVNLPFNNAEELVRQELGDYYDQMNNSVLIKKQGVHVDDFHQIKSVSGNVITMVEPIVYAVESRWGWKVDKIPYLENVGVEDITFQGDCVDDYVHHRTWNDDGGYKAVFFSRTVDSWIRRTDFIHITEAVSFTLSARVSAFDIHVSGKRGHSSIRSQNSVRAFIGKVFDYSDSQTVKGAGQWHAVGVSKHSLAAVLWRNEWGLDANFEAHASQPRATLIDACQGGFIRLRQGGGEAQLPNHLGDLVIWNFEATASEPERSWQWWDSETIWTRFTPPVMVGYHGAELIFEPSQTLIEESHGEPVEPESLYEAQLIRRLGKLPSWLKELKKL